MRNITLFILSAAALTAAPQLRLSTASIGPLNIAVGQNGPTQSIEAGNIGDGSLSLTATSNVAWITASIGGSHVCSSVPGSGGNCVSVQIALPTASLPKGIQTGIVTVSDPNAIDSPQNITVTVQMGGAVAVGHQLGAAGTQLIAQASQSFVHAMNSTVLIGAAIAWAGALVALALLPARPPEAVDELEIATDVELVLAAA